MASGTFEKNLREVITKIDNDTGKQWKQDSLEGHVDVILQTLGVEIRTKKAEHV